MHKPLLVQYSTEIDGKLFAGSILMEPELGFKNSMARLDGLHCALKRQICHRVFGMDTEGNPVKEIIENGRSYWEEVEDATV